MNNLKLRASSHSSFSIAPIIVLTVFVMAGVVQAQGQWTTTGTNISNTNTGNVGIGTTGPTRPLEVSAADGDAVRLYRPSYNINFGVNLKFALQNSNGLEVDYAGVHGQASSNAAGAHGGNLVFTTAGGGYLTEKMRITSAGNVGLGSTDVENWTGATSVIESLNTSLFFGQVTDIHLLSNAYNSTVWKYKTSGPASAYYLYNGTHGFRVASTGTVDGLVTWAEAMTITNSGKVGIGTTSPQSKFQVGTQTTLATATPDSLSLGGTYSTSAAQQLKLKTYDDGTNIYGIGVSVQQQDYVVPLQANKHVFYAAGSPLMTIKGTGEVGIGTTSPSTKLHVVGDGRITGNLIVDGNIAAKYQDVAEWVESSQVLLPGIVVVLDHTKSNQVIASSQAYDTRVAGVISAQPGIALGEQGEGKVLVATTGRVRIRVDATTASIQIGDLLVTGDREGMAIKSQPIKIGGVEIHRPGTLIGKALEPLAKGEGEILVLLSLQ
jgi:hypothetical protein